MRSLLNCIQNRPNTLLICAPTVQGKPFILDAVNRSRVCAFQWPHARCIMTFSQWTSRLNRRNAISTELHSKQAKHPSYLRSNGPGKTFYLGCRQPISCLLVPIASREMYYDV